MPRLAPVPLLLLLLAPEAAAAATVLDTRVTCAPVTVYAPAGVSSYTRACERGGAVLASQPVVVERGASVRVDPCPVAGDERR